MRTHEELFHSPATRRHLLVLLIVAVMLPLWAASEVTAGPPSCDVKPNRPGCPDPQPDPDLVYFDMHLGADGEFIIDASGPMVDPDGPMCADADELARVDQSTKNKFQLYVLFVCVPYTPWNPDSGEGRPSDVCYQPDPETCFTMKLQGRVGGTSISWILYNGRGDLSGIQGTGKGEVIGNDDYRLWGKLN